METKWLSIVTIKYIDMRIIKNVFLFVGLFMVGTLHAQQEAQYTQFMFNKLAFNPAYAGNAGHPCFSVLHRSQWVGLEGAPVSQVLNFHTPLKNDRVGIGMTVLHDKIGPANNWSYQLKYSYGIPIANGKLAIGLQGSMRRYRVDWSATNAIQSGDGLLMEDPASKILPNFGMGLYFQNNRFFLGASLPNILRGDLSFYEGSDNSSDFSAETPHYYFMGGLILKKGNVTKFKPSILVKYTEHAPLSIDLNAMLIFFDKFWLGTTYRLGGDKAASIGESVDAIVQYQLNRSIRAGISYDYSLSKMSAYNSGTFEVVLDYCIRKNDEVMTNPRFF